MKINIVKMALLNWIQDVEEQQRRIQEGIEKVRQRINGQIQLNVFCFIVDHFRKTT